MLLQQFQLITLCHSMFKRDISLCMLGNFLCFCYCLLIFFFQNLLVRKFFQEHYQCVNQFGSRSGPIFFRPGLGPNCLQRLSSYERLRSTLARKELSMVIQFTKSCLKLLFVKYWLEKTKRPKMYIVCAGAILRNQPVC